MRAATSQQSGEALEYLQRISGLQDQVERATSRAVRAERRIAELEDQLAVARASTSGGAKPMPIDGFYTFSEFIIAVSASLGRLDRWQSEYSEQTGIHLSKLQQWRKTNKVPATNYEMATNLSAPKSDGTKQRQSWTEVEYSRMEALLNGPDQPNYKTVAATLTSEWGRRITENAIKGAVNRRKSK